MTELEILFLLSIYARVRNIKSLLCNIH